MANARTTRLGEVVRQHEQEILSEWVARQQAGITARRDLMNESELKRQSQEFLNGFVNGASGALDDIHAPGWRPVLDLLSRISESRAVKGFSPTETAMFVYSLKQPIFAQLRKSLTDPAAVA